MRRQDIVSKNQHKEQATAANLQILELLDIDSKQVCLLYWVKSNLEKFRRKLETIKSDIANFKKKQLEIPELKNTIQISNLMDEFNGRLKIVELGNQRTGR